MTESHGAFEARSCECRRGSSPEQTRLRDLVVPPLLGLASYSSHGRVAWWFVCSVIGWCREKALCWSRTRVKTASAASLQVPHPNRPSHLQLSRDGPHPRMA